MALWFVTLAVIGLLGPLVTDSDTRTAAPRPRTRSTLPPLTLPTITTSTTTTAAPVATSTPATTTPSLVPRGWLSWTDDKGLFTISHYDGSARRNLTNVDGTPLTGYPFWSPTQRWLLVPHFEQVQGGRGSPAARADGFDIIDGTTFRARVLVPRGEERFAEWSWRPDEKALAVSVATDDKSGVTRIEVIDLPGGRRTVVATGSLPRYITWSKDAHLIAFIGGLKPNTLNTIDLRTRNQVQVATDVYGYGFAMAADGKTLAYDVAEVVDERGNTGGTRRWSHLVRSDGSGDSVLSDPSETSKGFFDHPVGFSRDGTRLLIGRDVDYGYGDDPNDAPVVVVDLASRRFYKIAGRRVAFGYDESWSHDGTAVMTVRIRYGDFRLWNFTTDEDRIVTDDQFEAIWSPDQTWVASVRRRGPTEVRSAIDGSLSLAIPSSDDPVRDHVFATPDSSAVYTYRGDVWEVYRVDGRGHWTFAK